MKSGSSMLTLTYESTKVIPNYNVMGVCKAALESSVKYIAKDLGSKGIRVNAVAPTYIDTDMTPISTTNKEWLKIWLDMTPMKRVGECDEIASAVLFLGSNASSLITGSILVVDAGYTIW